MLQVWCCFNNVRDGSLMVGLYTTITRITAFIIASYCSAYAKNVKNALGQPFEHIAVPTIQSVFLWIMVYSLLFIGAALMLLYGIYKDKHLYFAPWLTCMVLDLMGNSVIVVLCGIGVVSKLMVGSVIGGVLTVIIIYAFNVYCILCVVSHYENVKHKGIVADFYNHNHQRIPSISESMENLIIEDDNESEPSPSSRRSRLLFLTNKKSKNKKSTGTQPLRILQDGAPSSEMDV